MTTNNINRILDANINRASEALRVLEEYTRFIQNNTSISENLKNIRHLVNGISSQFSNLILYRESENDVGKEIKNNSTRKCIKDIIRANSKRVEEALRCICEYGQILNLNIQDLEKARYEIYSIEKELIKNEKIIRLQNAKLYLVANGDLQTIEKAIEGGINIIQLREKNSSEKEIIKLGNEIRKMTNGTEILFILNDRIDLALICGADGVHLGQDDTPISDARKITPSGFLIGLSTHSIEQGTLGIKSGADYLGVGPVYATPTKPDYIPAGLDYVKWASKNINIPWFAIGGVNENNITEVIKHGAKGVAVVRAIMNSKSPKETTHLLAQSFEKELAKNA